MNYINTTFDIVNGKTIYRDRTSDEKAILFRNLRKPLLAKFDTYKSLVNYGILTETPERHKVICDWYQKLLDITTTLDESVLTSYPMELEKY